MRTGAATFARGAGIAACLLFALACSDFSTQVHIVVTTGGIPTGFGARVAALGGEVERTHPELSLAVTRGLSDTAAMELAAFGDVERVTLDQAVRFVPRVDPEAFAVAYLPEGAEPASHDAADAFFFGSQWNMRAIDADLAWREGFIGDPDVRVAILDTGLDPDHIDLEGLIDEASSIAFVNSRRGPPNWADDHTHGTHVGGTVVSNGLGTSGVAPHTTLIAVKVCSFRGFCRFSNIIAGIVHAADEGADVINLSLGDTIPRPGLGPLFASLNRAVNYAHARGALVVSAAGNAAEDMDHNGARIDTPCESGVGMCVAATGPLDTRAFYSNFGRSAIDVAAPGGSLRVTGNPGTSMVLGPCSSRAAISPLSLACAGGRSYIFLQGTSMAAPHVAGTAALLDAQHGGALNASQLRTRLQQRADDLGEPGTDPAFGKGRINACEAVDC